MEVPQIGQLWKSTDKLRDTAGLILTECFWRESDGSVIERVPLKTLAIHGRYGMVNSRVISSRNNFAVFDNEVVMIWGIEEALEKTQYENTTEPEYWIRIMHGRLVGDMLIQMPRFHQFFERAM